MSVCFNQIVIDPGHGFCNRNGTFCAGHMSGNLHEVTCIDDLCADLIETLQRESMTYQLLETRKRPGLEPSARAAGILPRTVMISLHMGWAKAPARNGGHVYIAGLQSHPLAHALGDEMDRWGRQTIPHYAGVKVIETSAEWLPEPNVEQGILGIQIEPFCLNAIDALVYAARLRVLGTRLGNVLVSYLRAENPALGNQRTTVWGNGPSGREVFGG